MEKDDVLPQPNTLVKLKELPRLKTVPTKIGLLSINNETPKPVRFVLAVIRVLLASYYDVRDRLPLCEMIADGGDLMFKISWRGYWLEMDDDGDITVAEVET